MTEKDNVVDLDQKRQEVDAKQVEQLKILAGVEPREVLNAAADRGIIKKTVLAAVIRQMPGHADDFVLFFVVVDFAAEDVVLFLAADELW